MYLPPNRWFFQSGLVGGFEPVIPRCSWTSLVPAPELLVSGKPSETNPTEAIALATAPSIPSKSPTSTSTTSTVSVAYLQSDSMNISFVAKDDTSLVEAPVMRALWYNPATNLTVTASSTTNATCTYASSVVFCVKPQGWDDAVLVHAFALQR